MFDLIPPLKNAYLLGGLVASMAISIGSLYLLRRISQDERIEAKRRKNSKTNGGGGGDDDVDCELVTETKEVPVVIFDQTRGFTDIEQKTDTVISVKAHQFWAEEDAAQLDTEPSSGLNDTCE